jgi:SAM-dependent MidA family methyltransferase
VTLREVIVREIRERGPISFSRYMELCLYHPELGYYSRSADQFGKAGDFYTSSDVHAVFGRLLARQFDEMWRVLGLPEQIEILELGPGRGLFAQDVLDWSEKKSTEFFRALHYSLLERSPALRERLRLTLARHFKAGKASLTTDAYDPLTSSSRAAPGRSLHERLGGVEGSGVSPADGTGEPCACENSSRGAAEYDSPVRHRGPRSARSWRSGVERCRVGAKNECESRRDDTIIRASALEIPIIIFANEFFDALPVEILSAQGALRICEQTEGRAAEGETGDSYQGMPSGMPQERQSQRAFRRRIPEADPHDARLAESWDLATPEELEFLDRYSVHPEVGERIEVPLTAQRAMIEIAGLVQRGFILAIDYGYTRQQQLAGRHRGTLAAYRQHSEGSNPYEAPGEQDITAHVNFTALADTAARQGMSVQPLLTQSQFLLGLGEQNQFLDAFEECRLPQERAKVALQLKHLITPEGMGETFHVLLVSKGVASEKVTGLSGLNFGKGRLGYAG